jgi:hypothetical protein
MIHKRVTKRCPIFAKGAPFNYGSIEERVIFKENNLIDLKSILNETFFQNCIDYFSHYCSFTSRTGLTAKCSNG